MTENDAETWSGEDRRQQPRGWTFKREISIGNILSVVLLATPLFMWAVGVDKHVAIQDVAIGALQKNGERQDQQLSDLKRDIQTQLVEISHKLDRLSERSGR